MAKLNRRSKIAIALVCCSLVVAVLGFGYIIHNDMSWTRNGYRSEQLAPFLKLKMSRTARLEIFSLLPHKKGDDSGEGVNSAREKFYHYPVIDKALITDGAEMDLVRQVVEDIDHDGQRWEKAMLACFSPRHGIRIADGSESCDLLICYECTSAYILKGDEHVGTIYFHCDKSVSRATPDLLDQLLAKRIKE